MKKSKNKNKISLFIRKLNEIEINSLISSLKNINLDDLKKINIKDLTTKIKKSYFFKPSIGFIGGALFFTLLFIPSVDELISSFNKARRYKQESNNLVPQSLKLEKLDLKITNSKLLLSELNESIISKKDIIFVSKLINQTALRANVNIISIVPVEVARSGQLCKEPNQSGRSSQSRKIKSKKGSFQENYFEINLLSNYFDLIKFLNIIQYYDVVMLPNCLEVLIVDDINYNKMDSKNTDVNSPSKIISLSESGVPIDTISSDKNLNLDSSFNQVKIRLVLKIPSHSS